MRDIDAGGDHFALLFQQGHGPGVAVPASALSVHHPRLLWHLGAAAVAVHLLALRSSVTGALLQKQPHGLV